MLAVHSPEDAIIGIAKLKAFVDQCLDGRRKRQTNAARFTTAPIGRSDRHPGKGEKAVAEFVDPTFEAHPEVGIGFCFSRVVGALTCAATRFVVTARLVADA